MIFPRYLGGQTLDGETVTWVKVAENTTPHRQEQNTKHVQDFQNFRLARMSDVSMCSTSLRRESATSAQVNPDLHVRYVRYVQYDACMYVCMAVVHVRRYVPSMKNVWPHVMCTMYQTMLNDF